MLNFHRFILSLLSVSVLSLSVQANESSQGIFPGADNPEKEEGPANTSVMFSEPDNNQTGLVAALKATLKYNPAIKSQETEVLVQGDAIDAAKAGWFPTLSGSITSESDDNSYVELDQPLWTFGKISSAINSEKATLNVVKHALLQEQRNLMESTANAYTQVQAAWLKIEVAEDNLREHKRLYTRIQNRNSAQLASTADVNLARSRLLQARADLLNYQAERQAALNELYTLTRIQVDTVTPVNLAIVQLPDDRKLRRLAVEENADVSYAQQEVYLAQAELAQTESSPYPTISFNVQQYLDSNNDETYVGVVLNGSVEGLGISAYNNIQGSEKSIVAAQYNLDAVRNNAVRETDNYLVNIDLQKGLRDSQAQTVAELENTMASFLRQYNLDRKTWVEVLNQQRELANMRNTLIDTDRQYTVLILQLAIKTGCLDEIAGVEQ